MYMKNNVARCIRAVQKRQEVNFNNSLLLLHNLILLKIIEIENMPCILNILLKTTFNRNCLLLPPFESFEEDPTTPLSQFTLNNCDKFYLCLLFLAYNLCSKLYTNSLKTLVSLSIL